VGDISLANIEGDHEETSLEDDAMVIHANLTLM
jgi:hypothetical protein